MSREVVSTDLAPAAIGPYSQAMKAGGMLYVSGQLGMDPATGDMVAGGVEAEARQAMANLQAICAAAGTDLKQAVRCTIYLTDLGDFAAVNAIYAEGLFHALSRPCLRSGKRPAQRRRGGNRRRRCPLICC